MKRILFLPLLLVVAIMPKSQAQDLNFAPIGASWYYETQGMFTRGYIRMEVEKDTVIDGQACIKLQREWHRIELQFGVLQEGQQPPLYLSQNGDTVMIYHNGGFHLLFDFGAEIGDTWTVIGQEGVCDEDFGTVKVVDKGTEEINGMTLRTVTIKDEAYSYWGYGNSMYGTTSGPVKIVERIGPVGSYLLPEQRCVFDVSEGGPLRCYIDEELGELHLSSDYPDRNCDYINETYQSVDEDTQELFVDVQPTPTGGIVTILGRDLAQAEVYDALGQRVATVDLKGEQGTIDLSGQPAGIYFVNVTDREGRRCVRKVIKQ